MANILVVDDSQFMRKRCEKILLEFGHTVHQAENGLLGVNKFQEINPDLVLMDITMPEMDGITAVQHILACNKEALVIMMSSVEKMKDIQEAISKGAKHFIIKPFDADHVNKVINSILTKYHDTTKLAHPNG